MSTRGHDDANRSVEAIQACTNRHATGPIGRPRDQGGVVRNGAALVSFSSRCSGIAAVCEVPSALIGLEVVE